MDVKFRQFGCPHRIGVVSDVEYAESVARFVQSCAERREPAYQTVYWYRSEQIDKKEAIVDRLTGDVDGAGHGVLNEVTMMAARKAIEWLVGSGYKPRVKFSGNSGFEITLRFEEVQLDHPNEAVTTFLRTWNQKVGGVLDTNAMKGTTQLIRIPSSRHQKSGLYAIPLTIEEVMTLSASQILELAKTPRPYSESPTNDELEANQDLRLVLERMDTEAPIRIYKPRKILSGDLGKVPLKPCIAQLIELADVRHDDNVKIGIAMVARGFTDEEIHAVFKKRSERSTKYVYNEGTTQYHIDYIRQKGYIEHSCATLKDAGLCIVPIAANEKECVPLLENLQRRSTGKKLSEF